MAFTGGTYGTGAANGNVITPLSTILASVAGREEFRQIDIKAPAANAAGFIYIGPATVSASNAWVELAAGESFGLNPQSFTSPAGGDFKMDLSQTYVVGTAAAMQAFVSVLL